MKPFGLQIGFFLVLMSVVKCELQKTEFYHNGILHTVLHEYTPTRAKREVTNSDSNKNATKGNECYQYTALGGTKNSTDFEGTPTNYCEKRKHLPCFLPFVFTEDGSLPSPSVVHQYCEEYGCKVTCPKSTHTCIRYSYIADGLVSNSTYFCGDVQDTTDNVILKVGYVTDTLIGGIVQDVYYCQDDLCNSSTTTQLSFILLLLISICFFIFK